MYYRLPSLSPPRHRQCPKSSDLVLMRWAATVLRGDYTVGVNKNCTLVFVNFSAQDAWILKISVPIIKRRFWGFQKHHTFYFSMILSQVMAILKTTKLFKIQNILSYEIFSINTKYCIFSKCHNLTQNHWIIESKVFWNPQDLLLMIGPE